MHRLHKFVQKPYDDGKQSCGGGRGGGDLTTEQVKQSSVTLTDNFVEHRPFMLA